MSELPSVYNPDSVEERATALWRERRLAASQPDGRAPYAIVIPPPNVTGSLHMGHALNNTLQDVLIRWRHLKGDNTLWIPGTDHGGIATQNVVEKLLKKEGKTRHDLGRDKFLEKMWAWRQESGDTILMQLRRLGCSLDWDRTRFTMDEASSKAVLRAFVELHVRGLIYLGKRLVNWCPRCATALSDIEVEYEERSGHLWHIRYPLADGSGDVVVATTRPETMLGDRAVAVHPQDARYTALQGTKIRLPLRQGHVNETIPLIADDIVDQSFGSGAVKVTPAHDFVDFEIQRRHPAIGSLMVIGYDGKMTPAAGTNYQGLSVTECRKKVVEDLDKQGFLVKTEPYTNNVSICYRCLNPIEPLESSQWFVKTQSMARRAAQATEDGRVKIHPESWTKPYLSWLNTNKDWCVSRQIWWGHRIPIWYCRPCLKKALSPEDAARVEKDPEFLSQWSKEILRSIAEDNKITAVAELKPSCPACGGSEMFQDPDVLDTWFSSGLWPLTTLGWPEETADLRYYYPTSVLATGHEILYLWVARMVMMGLEFRGEVPFRDVFIHGIVRDKQGRKMSKSLNNVIDPLDVMKKFGADALRFALVSQAAPGRDMQLSDDSFIGARNFANKIWNAVRYALGHLAGYRPADVPPARREAADRWILRRLAETMDTTDRFLDQFDPAQAARALYAFFWNDFCDWYLEISKHRLLNPDAPAAARDAARQTLWEVLNGALRALHPVMPFITEELSRALREAAGLPAEPALLETPAVPFPDAVGDDDMADMAFLQNAVTALRTLRSEMNVPPGKPLTVAVHHARAAETSRRRLERTETLLRHLAKVGELRPAPGATPPPQSAACVVEDMEFFVPLEGLIDFAKEKQRLEKEETEADRNILIARERLENPDFLSRAPVEKVAEMKQRLADMLSRRERLGRLTAALK
jgi:valyl-tRNA synthetase